MGKKTSSDAWNIPILNETYACKIYKTKEFFLLKYGCKFAKEKDVRMEK